jgi:hypothetical protein
MKSLHIAVFTLAALSLPGLAQQWEVGGGAGFSYVPPVPVSGAAGSATTGFQPGYSFGAFLGQSLYQHLGGEIRYGFMQSNLKLSSGGATTTFSGQSHVLGYDVLLRTERSDSRTQFFAALGGGMKIYRGTGKEEAYQELSQFGYFTKTQKLKPMVDFGAGLKYRLSPRMALRVEVRDYLTLFPQEIITPAPGVKFGSLLHDIVPMVSLSYQY